MILFGSFIDFFKAYPLFERQRSRVYIELTECKYTRYKLNHDLSLRYRDKHTIKLLEKELKEAYKPEFDDSNWLTGKLPFAVNKYPDRYQGGVLYRIKFYLPEKFKGKSVKLYFLGVNYTADVWLNGKWIGYHEGGFTPFVFDITDSVKAGEQNLLFVRVDNIPWLGEGAGYVNRHNIVPYKKVDWWNYTGILRDVYIEVSPKIHVVRCNVLYKINKKARLKILSVFFNGTKKKINGRVAFEIYPACVNSKNILSFYSEDLICEGERALASKKEEVRLVPGTNVLKIDMDLDEPRLWELGNPFLYVLRVSLKAYKFEDEVYFQFGLRKLEAKGNSVYLNGRAVFLKGASYHEEFYPYGRVMDSSKFGLIYQNLRILKDLNANFLRTAHYPHHPFTYYLTDRMGIAVWEEIPVVWFDGPELIYQLKNRRLPQKMLAEMIYANFNCPSILFHGLCNECGWQEERKEYLWNMKKIGKGMAPFRLFAQSAVGADLTDNTHRDMDLVGNTMYFGVFYGSSPYKDTLNAVKTITSFFYDKPFIATEFGYWSNIDNSELEKQKKIAVQTFKAFVDSGRVSAAVWWSLFDWHTMITGVQTMGLISMDRTFVKPAFLELQKLYGKKIRNYRIIALNLPSKARGKLRLKIKVKPPRNVKSVSFSCNSLKFAPALSLGEGLYSFVLDTIRLPEGYNDLIVRVEIIEGEVLYKKIRLFVDNRDEPPELTINIKDNKILTKNFPVKIQAKDDRMIKKAFYTLDKSGPKYFKGGRSSLTARIFLPSFENGTRHILHVVVEDDGGNLVEKRISFIYDDSPGINVPLPYNLDRISYKNNKKDAYYWSFPAEELPPSGEWVVCEGCNAKFLFPKKEDGFKNVMVCRGQYVSVKPDFYSVLNVFGYSYWGNQDNRLVLFYKDGSREEKELLLSEWTNASPQFGDHVAFSCSKHYEWNGKEGRPPVCCFHQKICVNVKKKLVGIQFPNDEHKHILAISLERGD